MSVENNGFSMLSNIEGQMITLNFFVLTPISIGLFLTICIILFRDIKLLQTKKEEENVYPRYAMICACVATISALLCGITVLLFCNDLIIGWNYVSSNHILATVTESLTLSLYVMIKISFYFGFTFHLQSIVYSWSNNLLPTYWKISMVLFAIYSIAATMFVIYDDVTVFANSEIGVTSKHNIHIALMILSYDANVLDIVELLSLGSIVIDLLYYGVLMFLFSTKLKQMDDNIREKGVKCLALLIISHLLFWVLLVSNVLNLPFKYVASSLNVMANCICLFLVFDSGRVIYNNLCNGLCHVCVGKICYGWNYKPPSLTKYATDEDTHADILL